MILLDPIADNPNWIKQDKGAWDINMLDIIPGSAGHLMTWGSHGRTQAPLITSYFLFYRQQSFPPPTMSFYEQANNTEWGKVIQVRLIFAPFMNSFLGHNLRRLMDEILPPAITRIWLREACTHSGSRRRNKTEKGTCQGRRNEHLYGGAQTVWAFLMVSLSLPPSNKSNTCCI